MKKDKDDFRKRNFGKNERSSDRDKRSNESRPAKKYNSNDFSDGSKNGGANKRNTRNDSFGSGFGSNYKKNKDAGFGNSEKSSFRDKGTGNSQNRSTTRTDFNDRKTVDNRKRNDGGDGNKRRTFNDSSSTGKNFKSDKGFNGGKNQSERGDRKSFENTSDHQKGKTKSFAKGKGKYEAKDTKGDKRPLSTPDYVLKEKISDAAIRLNRYIANSGVCSRREADELIAQGLIEVNGKVITELGYKVNPGDAVKYDGKALRKEKNVYILLNKPKDYITTMDDPEERKTVMQLIAGACKERVYPVGRLDRNTTGLLLLTNDGELAEKLTHPSNKITKIYQVELDAPLSKEDMEKIAAGQVYLEDGRVQVDEIAFVDKDKHKVGLAIHEGRNRIVRRLFEHLEYQVVRLDRTVYAGLTKRDLPRGQWRFLTEKELVSLKFKK